MKNLLKIEVDNKRIFGLDILRCCAVMFVVIGHSNDLLPTPIAHYLSYIVLDGVAIFFVLSGFLIGGILIKLIDSKQVSWSLLINFWIRRWFRTLPNYILVLSILAVFFRIDFGFFAKYASFTQNLYKVHPWFFPEAWSLSIEEWFYLIVPFCIFTTIILFKLKPQKAVFYTAIFFLFAITFVRYYKFNVLPYQSFNQTDLYLNFKNQVITRLDSIMYGLIGAYLNYYYKAYWLKYKVFLLGAGIGLIILNESLEQNYQNNLLYFTVFSSAVGSIGTLFLLPFLGDFNPKLKTGFLFNIITKISLVSYSMYLINYTIVRNIIMPSFSTLGSNFIGKILSYSIFWIITAVLSTLIYKYFEMPLTKIRDKF
jgi:peptidoglycan/LPS O-acetylase OafA/YrhL